jgi:acyl-CoA thioesterase FadM
MTNRSSLDTASSALSMCDEHLLVRRPCVEGCNVGTWLGFKHVTYLLQEGVLDWLRAHQLGMGPMFETYGLATEVVNCRVRFLKALRVNDLPTVSVKSISKPSERQATFVVGISRQEGTVNLSLAQGRMNVVWRPAGVELGAVAEPPEELQPFISPVQPSPPERLSAADRDELPAKLRPRDKISISRWHRVAYPQCCYTDRMQFSAYVGLLEGMVDEFLAEREVSIGTLLRERRWIPVVSRFEMEIAKPVFMEEMLLGVLSIDKVVKNLIFTARLDCYVLRQGDPLRVMTCEIDHAYLQFDSRDVGATIVPLDGRVVQALLGPDLPQ